MRPAFSVDRSSFLVSWIAAHANWMGRQRKRQMPRLGMLFAPLVHLELSLWVRRENEEHQQAG